MNGDLCAVAECYVLTEVYTTDGHFIRVFEQFVEVLVRYGGFPYTGISQEHCLYFLLLCMTNGVTSLVGIGCPQTIDASGALTLFATFAAHHRLYFTFVLSWQWRQFTNRSFLCRVITLEVSIKPPLTINNHCIVQRPSAHLNYLRPDHQHRPPK